MKKLLLASVSGLALTGLAHAADMAVPVLKAPPPAANWAGFYLGIDGGVARHDAFFNNLDNAFNPGEATLSTTATGAFGGGFVGYNLQDRSFVYGLEADINGFGVKASEDWNAASVGIFGQGHTTQSQEVPWVATFRGRLGLDVESTLFYITGGLAVGEVKNNVTSICGAAGGCLNNNFVTPNGGTLASFNEDTTRLGFAVGAGFEHLFSSHFLLRGEMRYVDLGKKGVTCASNVPTFNVCSANNGPTSPNYRGEFSNTLMSGMLGLGYKF